MENHWKQHRGDVCTDHIDRMNGVALCLETRLFEEMPEAGTKRFSGKLTPEAVAEMDQWVEFCKKSNELYLQVNDLEGNRFFMSHAMDTRGRCYCGGYYINYQGASYKKAMVQLANKEVVKI